MDRLRIVGGQRLEGAVTISGAKNAALPQIAAALLSPYPLELTNLPDVTDVENMLGVVRLHGAEVTRSAHAATIDTSAAVSKETSYDTVRKMRATVLVLAPLLARFGHARVSLPGGCAIGARPVDMHVAALAALGARIAIENGSIVASVPNGLTGTRIVLSSPSVGATETAIMAATTAKGETEILNAAREPEVADLAACLNAMGARIEGAGTHRILIAGDTSWHAARHDIIPDRIEAGTHLLAGAATQGSVEVTGARADHLDGLLSKLAEAGASVEVTPQGVCVGSDGPLQAIQVQAVPYPGFATDLHAPMAAALTQAQGVSIVHERVYDNRLLYIGELRSMGARLTAGGQTGIIEGPARLSGTGVRALDIRAGAAVVIGGLCAEGETTIRDIGHIDRGYSRLVERLRALGADIDRR